MYNVDFYLHVQRNLSVKKVRNWDQKVHQNKPTQLSGFYICILF